MKKSFPAILLIVVFAFSSATTFADGVIPTGGKTCPPDAVCFDQPSCQTPCEIANSNTASVLPAEENTALTEIIDAVSNVLNIIF